jgi:L,D-peptidoglycan transpeptidase YkuD (ErfK/YbiS/YcfS/YnhG family)
MSIFRLLLMIAMACSVGARAHAAACPEVLDGAKRLAVVTVPDMGTTAGTLRTFERADQTAAWRETGAAQSVVIGRRGLGWGHPFATLAKPGEPVKREGDKKTPAGIYRLGATFGFDAAARDGHLELRPGVQYCVDDTSSPHYGRIVERTVAGAGTSGENMGAEPLYKRGLVIDYPPNAAAKAGSCIFLHIWEGAGKGTAGCVAMPEAGVARLQEWAGGGDGAIALVSEDTKDRFAGCLPE